jgi:repressor LexA
MKKVLTSRQMEILEFIKTFLHTHKFPPTVREVAANFRISVKGSYDHIKALEKKGWLNSTLSKFRTLELVDEAAATQEASVQRIRILGNVAAGNPIFAEENYNGDIDVPARMLGKGEYFALSVKGDSMKDAGILDGDIAIINRQSVAENGQIVVALLDDSATLKKFYKERNRVKLKSENADYPPIYATDVRILGKLSCVIRQYA